MIAQHRNLRIAADQKLIAGVQQHLAQLASVVPGMYKQTPGTLADFGLRDRKVTKPSVDTLAAAHAKAKASSPSSS